MPGSLVCANTFPSVRLVDETNHQPCGKYRSDAVQTKEATGTDDQLGGNDAASET